LKKLIYYYRHGETYYSARNMGYGDKEYEALLTDKGRQQVNLLGVELARRGPFDLHLTSPLPRAVQSATIVQSYLNKELQIDQALLEGIKQSREEIWNRVVKLAERLIKAPEEKILLSTHGIICCCLAGYFRGQTWRNMNIENLPTAAFGWIELEDGLPKRGCRISTVHLTPANAA
jgi:broad specificity phosphatase PhoE